MHLLSTLRVILSLTGVICANYTIFTDTNSASDNQTSIATSIVNGMVTSTDYYPFISQLYITENNGFSYSFICTAELIGQQHIITAAHCVSDDNMKLRSPSLFRLNIGSATLATLSDIINFYTVTNIYGAGFATSFANDVVILRLNKPVPSSIATPVKIYPYKITANLPVEVAGFGSIYYGGPISKTLLRTLINVSDSSNCSAFNPDWANNSGPLVCSISINGNAACNGDSGGPMVAKLNGKRVLVGTVSWGENMDPKSNINCGANNVSFYVRTAYFVKWIASVMNVDYNTLIEIVNSS
ncbi:CUB and peptidase domain-containing protein 1 [Smittium mucronatum]|uniref:CUB and peptidase domain-containing protein 1 n=1 Tax=Smittium mucronatum TaxID=133383 RepID=A0A1R0GY91_9FUNG|nr:CUB and peptidase domain-containing protein 1 [Smittium mucronatum]OLY81872.1 CUB and peptidase domain-containing protein 1 [Smittium mucronatum]